MAEWLACDEAIRVKTAELNVLREKRRVLGERIIANGGDPLVRVVSRRVYTPLTFAFLEEALLEVVSDEGMVAELMEHVRDRREYKVVREIRRQTQRTRRAPNISRRAGREKIKILKDISKEN
jgi:hypothetical protein